MTNRIEPGTTRVLIVDDERLFAELLRVALRSADGIEVVDVVHDVQAAVRRMTELRPDVVLADYHLPDGTGADIARTVRATLPDTSVLILTGDPSVTTLSDVARSGAVGHLTKDRPFDEVVEGVRAAAQGEILFAPSELQRLLLERETRPRPLEPLTARELEVLQLLAEGASTGQASEQLGISSATLRAHVQAILRKLGAHSRLEAVAEAARLGVITLDTWTREKTATRPTEVV
ncbi:MAG TPA: DNA-binding response regulator [Chloroflexi bacterium]|jgi:DNA-binding NarL/FixJ family response regulator|nr:DNA-binding response regulator [Chloroflexota bacterium]HAL25348.1 DNA-binding response regulator [Chloroflexota bacterium]